MESEWRLQNGKKNGKSNSTGTVGYNKSPPPIKYQSPSLSRSGGTQRSPERGDRGNQRYPVRGDRGNKSPQRGGNAKRRAALAKDIPDYDNPEEETIYKALKAEYPNMVIPGEIRRLENLMNIDNLSVKLLSPEGIEIQKQGWEYVKVVKPDDPVDGIPEDTEEIEYTLEALENKYGDMILFKRQI